MSDPITSTELPAEDAARELAMEGLDGEGPAPNENEAVDAAERTQAKAARKAPKAAKAKPATDKPARPVKRDVVLALLARKRGATVAEIAEVTGGWQKHTIRGFIATAPKKAGLTVISEKNAKGERVYRTTKEPAA